MAAANPGEGAVPPGAADSSAPARAPVAAADAGHPAAANAGALAPAPAAAADAELCLHCREPRRGKQWNYVGSEGSTLRVCNPCYQVWYKRGSLPTAAQLEARQEKDIRQRPQAQAAPQQRQRQPRTRSQHLQQQMEQMIQGQPEDRPSRQPRKPAAAPTAGRQQVENEQQRGGPKAARPLALEVQQEQPRPAQPPTLPPLAPPPGPQQAKLQVKRVRWADEEAGPQPQRQRLHSPVEDQQAGMEVSSEQCARACCCCSTGEPALPLIRPQEQQQNMGSLGSIPSAGLSIPAVLQVGAAGLEVQPAALRMFRNAGGSEDSREAILINGPLPSWAIDTLESAVATNDGVVAGGEGAGGTVHGGSGGGGNGGGRRPGAAQRGRLLPAPGEQRRAALCACGAHRSVSLHASSMPTKGPATPPVQEKLMAGIMWRRQRGQQSGCLPAVS